jgi:hypothetical protein
MPNHGRGRIRAAALHAWHNQEMHLIDRHCTLTTHDNPFDRWSAEGRDVSGEEKEIGCRQIPYVPPGEILTSNDHMVPMSMTGSSKRRMGVICL